MKSFLKCDMVIRSWCMWLWCFYKASVRIEQKHNFRYLNPLMMAWSICYGVFRYILHHFTMDIPPSCGTNKIANSDRYPSAIGIIS